MARLRHRLRAVGLDFLDTAPLKLVFSAAVAAPPDAVYHALAEVPEGWSEWFGVVKSVRPTGTGRHVVLTGRTRFDETVLAADGSGRYAYRVDATNRPGARALLEEWRVQPAARCSLVRWTIAVDPAPAAGLLLRLSAPVLRSSFRAAMQELGRGSA